MDDNQKKIADFIEKENLYRKITISTDVTTNLFKGIKFDFNCQHCKRERGFTIRDNPLGSYNRTLSSKTQNQGITVLIQALCDFCDNGIDIVLNLEYKRINIPNNSLIHTDIRKVGQYPKINLTPPVYIEKFLTDGEKSLYENAKICECQSYGIGSYIYLRRTIESIGSRLLENLDKANYDKLKQEDDMHSMTDIMSSMAKYLPSSVNTNMFTTIYKLTSEGLHNRTEEDFEKEMKDDKTPSESSNVFTLFDYLIKKLHEEGTEVKTVNEIGDKLAKQLG